MADMTAEDLRRTLAEGGEAAMEALVERAKTAPGSVFDTETVSALAHLYKTNLPTWVNLRARLRREAPDVPISELDKRVRLSGGDASGGDDRLPGRALKYDEIEPWDEPVDGEQLLTEIATAIGCYVVMDAYQWDAAALWVVFAHAHDFFVYAPLLVITSPVRRCGKTRLQEMLARLTPRPQSMSGITAAALARVVEKDRPTVFIDEFDAIAKSNREMGESLRGQLNSSFNRSSAHILKSVRLSRGSWEVRLFSTWAPTCIAGIGHAPDTVMDRSIVLNLTRKLVGQKISRLRGKDGGELTILARKAARWVADNEHRLRRSEPASLATLNDRAADAWEPLFAIADAAGGGWPARARAAAKMLTGAQEAAAAETDNNLTLLSDIRDIFADEFPPDHKMHKQRMEDAEHDGLYGPRLPTVDLLIRLHGLEERPWSSWGTAKQSMTGKALGDLLRPYGVRSRTIRVGSSTSKGYYLRSFEDAFVRYLTLAPPSKRHAVTTPRKPNENESFASVTSETCDGLETAGNASKSAGCDGVTLQRGGGSGSEGNDRPADDTSDGLTETLL
jgi:putative DNA primase/helicase